MNHCNHLEWKHLCNFVQPQKKFVYEILPCVALFVGFTLLLAIISNHNIQRSTKTLPDSNQVGLAKVISGRITTAYESLPSSAGVNVNINNLLKNTDVKELIELPFTQTLSASQIDEIINIFGLPSLNYSIDLKRQFLDCSGIELLRQSVKKEGILHIPKHFQTCKNMTFQKTGDSVALLSWPGSGNSWVRQLLETTTGIYTGAFYCDPNYIHAGMLGEGVKTNNVLVMKIHWAEGEWLPQNMIYIVRNPFDCIFVEWNRYLQQRSHPLTHHTASASQENFGKQSYLYFDI